MSETSSHKTSIGSIVRELLERYRCLIRLNRSMKATGKPPVCYIFVGKQDKPIFKSHSYEEACIALQDVKDKTNDPQSFCFKQDVFMDMIVPAVVSTWEDQR